MPLCNLMFLVYYSWPFATRRWTPLTGTFISGLCCHWSRSSNFPLQFFPHLILPQSSIFYSFCCCEIVSTKFLEESFLWLFWVTNTWLLPILQTHLHYIVYKIIEMSALVTSAISFFFFKSAYFFSLQSYCVSKFVLSLTFTGHLCLLSSLKPNKIIKFFALITLYFSPVKDEFYACTSKESFLKTQNINILFFRT